MPHSQAAMPHNLIPLLAELESRSRALDWDGAMLDRALAAAGRFGRGYLDGLASAPAYHGEGGRPVFDAAPPNSPAELEQVLAEFAAQVLPFGLNATSGRFFGYVPGGGLPSAALGDFLAALTNRYAGVYQASPGAAGLENAVVRWLLDLIGLPATGWGTLQSGGSLATLTALVAARGTRPAEEWGRSPIYLTRECHHAAHRALHVAGLGGALLRQVPTDAAFRMNVDALARLVAEDRRAGLSPWIVVASAGTVNTGAVDPLDAIADLAAAERLWLHVDGAYGGFFALAPSGAKILKGLARADSLVLDPHKGLFQPYGCGAALVRDGRQLRAAFASSADYLADVAHETEMSPADVSPELTRHFRGLRLWLSLKVHGLDRFRAALEEKLLLARVAHAELAADPAFIMGPEPELSCVTVRAAAGDTATAALLSGLLARGRVHLSSTRLNGELYLRLCVLSFRSHLGEVAEAAQELKAVAKNLRLD